MYDRMVSLLFWFSMLNSAQSSTPTSTSTLLSTVSSSSLSPIVSVIPYHLLLAKILCTTAELSTHTHT